MYLVVCTICWALMHHMVHRSSNHGIHYYTRNILSAEMSSNGFFTAYLKIFSSSLTISSDSKFLPSELLLSCFPLFSRSFSTSTVIVLLLSLHLCCVCAFAAFVLPLQWPFFCVSTPSASAYPLPPFCTPVICFYVSWKSAIRISRWSCPYLPVSKRYLSLKF